MYPYMSLYLVLDDHVGYHADPAAAGAEAAVGVLGGRQRDLSPVALFPSSLRHFFAVFRSL